MARSIDAVILAAGLSKRMGCDKLLLPVAGSTLFGTFLSRFPFSLFTKTAVIVAKDEVAGICRNFPVGICHNDTPETGQAHSIHLGLANTTPGNPILFSVADQPLIRHETISRLVEMSSENPGSIIQPRVNSLPGNPVIFPADLRDELAGLAGDSGGREIIRHHNRRVTWLDLDSADQFFDIDTPEEYQEFLRQWPNHH
ncbi:nucleotidyltransferase family protein [Desulfosediminicola sp.]|uniref:nucleotidyltransferase family protein n=1 Tax=Desulfosediminicola sp. TaxID=2886825 RepID=UPI003AF1FE5F